MQAAKWSALQLNTLLAWAAGTAHRICCAGGHNQRSSSNRCSSSNGSNALSSLSCRTWENSGRPALALGVVKVATLQQRPGLHAVACPAAEHTCKLWCRQVTVMHVLCCALPCRTSMSSSPMSSKPAAWLPHRYAEQLQQHEQQLQQLTRKQKSTKQQQTAVRTPAAGVGWRHPACCSTSSSTSAQPSTLPLFCQGAQCKVAGSSPCWY